MRPLTIPLYLLVALAALLLTACGDERDTVVRVVHQVADAAELKNVDGMLAFVAADYRDPAGRDRDRLRAQLVPHLARAERIDVAFRKVKVKALAEDRATVVLEAVLAQGEVGERSLADVLPDSWGAWRFTLEMEKEPGGWRITSAEEQMIPPAAFLIGTP